jgi:hypothetical protein
MYKIINEKYNINYDLKFDSFNNFLESLKDSKKYYHDYCTTKNISTRDFDTEYINTINILKSELLKSYILITNDKDAEKYVIVNETIRDLYDFMNQTIKEVSLNENFTGFRVQLAYNYQDCLMSGVDVCMTNLDAEFITSININWLTRSQLSKLIFIYAFNAKRYIHFKKGFLTKMNIINNNFFGLHDYIKLEYCPLMKNFNESKNNYLNTLTYESIYKREFNKILTNLPNTCVSNILSKPLKNINKENFIYLDNEWSEAS